MNRGAIILCGGKSSRMGRDKASMPFGPELMLQRIQRIISQVVPPSAIVVVAAQGQTLPKLPPAVLVARDQRPSRGPLEGLAAGLAKLPAGVHAVYASSCDVPLIKAEFVEMMFEQLKQNEIAVAFDGQHHHPLAAVYRPSVLPTITRLLAADRLRPRFLFDEVATVEVGVETLRRVDASLSSLLNLNLPEDYDRALRAAGLSPLAPLGPTDANDR